ncbi:DUF6387 family protein [Burkholderia pseudomallei]|uniref:DUF6387 family protein n=1 Tax=Burkholderia pseudomallei TaxID=28450 RepID=UPI00126025F1|nr:DUF6387 family protein [Burkholderia pseudomallei]
MATKATLADLPRNFDINKYKICATWDLSWWAANIYRRISRKSQIEGEMANNAQPDEQHRALLREVTAEAFDDPGLNCGSSDEGPIDFNYGSPLAAARRVTDMSAMEALRAYELFHDDSFKRYSDAYLLARSFNPYSPDFNEINYELKLDAFELLEKTPEWKMFADSEVDDLGVYAFSKVDLMAPDKDLMEDFRAWLSLARANFGIADPAPSFAQQDVDRWASMHVLAYIDLTLWASANGLKIPLTVMGRALFPDEFEIGLEDRVRKVVARDARQLMDMEAVRAMQSHFLKSEQEKAKFDPDQDVVTMTPAPNMN